VFSMCGKKCPKQLHFQIERNSEKMICFYLSGLLSVNSLLILWFYSPLSSSIAKYIFKKDNVLTLDDFLDFIYIKNEILGKLLSCWICMSFWLSLIIGIVLAICFSLPMYFPILTFFTYPALLFLVKQQYR
jgi:hypothetical protein